MNEITSEKGFKILHFNIRSLWKNQHEFFIQLKGFDIITLSETWLHPHIPDCLISEAGYSLIRQDRTSDLKSKTKSKGGGLIVFVKICYFEFVSKLDNLSPTGLDLEHIWLKFEIPFRKKIVLGVCYRPPSGGR